MIKRLKLWPILSGLMVLSVSIVVWLSYELGVFDVPSLMASDSKSDQSEKSPAGADAEPVKNRDRELADREALLNKQTTYYEQNYRELKDKCGKNTSDQKAASEKLVKEQKEKFEKEIADGKSKYERLIASQKSKIDELEAEKAEKVLAFRQVYEKMDPKKAAIVFDELETDLAVQLLSGMKPKVAAEIMGKMTPQKAKIITEKVLSRRKTSAAQIAGQ